MSYEIEKIKIKNCLNCDCKLTDSQVLCPDCYKLNLNTLYKVLKSKTPDKITFSLLKEFIKNEKYNNSNSKNKINIVIEHKKHYLDL